jgi:tripartite-type tricarboxylate transporter receptor subunit TctC
MPINRRWMVATGGAAIACGVTGSALGQARYPEKPIRLIVPYSPGGPYDQIPRIVADHVGRKLGWTVLIDNRPGVSGIVGVVVAKQAAPDGYTFVVTSSSTHGAEPALKHPLPYDPYTDLAPVILFGQAALVLLVRKEMNIGSVAELIKVIRAKPGEVKFSSAGHATQQHLAAVMMLQREGLPPDACTHVPYNGLTPALTALLSKAVDFMIVSTGSAKGFIESGDLLPLAITTPERSARLPNVPTFAEVGYPGYQIIAWCGLAAPAKTPRPILDRWNVAMNEALSDPEVRKRIDDMDYDVRGGSAAAYTDFFTRDIEAYKTLAAATGLTDD